MWDRFRQKEGTAPSLDRKKLEAWQNAHSAPSTAAVRGVTGGNSQYQYAVRGGPPPTRPPRDVDYLPENAQQQHHQQQQQSPSHLSVPAQAPPTNRNYQRDSFHGRPTSSVYSQPSPEAAVFAAQQLRNGMAYHDPLEISPPSSPDVALPREGPYPGDVSPIEETPDASQLAQGRHVTPTKPEPRSNIPMMRRERRKNSDAAMNALRESKSRDRTTPPRPYGHDVRWDPRTGEPTTSAKGRPSQVNPQEYAHGLTNQVDSVPSTESRSNPLNITSLRDRLRPVRPTSTSTSTSASPQAAPAPRPEWRGASGRTAIVPPVRDNKLVAKLRIPPRSGKRADQGLPVLSPVESNGSGAASSPLQTAAQNPPPPENNKDSATFSGVTPSAQRPQSPAIATNSPSAYPTPPLSEDPVRANRPPVQGPTATASSQPRLRIPSNDKAIRRKPARVPSGQEPESPTPSEHLQHDAGRPQGPTGGSSNERTQPPSRSNITAYATPDHAYTLGASLDEYGSPLHTPPELSLLSQATRTRRG
ncbi:hypothetical protein F4859DRAFT_196417 [Xylaria cf. heliscus]|nr:hypothetical protein F4859DRAFT_196417 [Xylaria cf. heliscus]